MRRTIFTFGILMGCGDVTVDSTGSGGQGDGGATGSTSSTSTTSTTTTTITTTTGSPCGGIGGVQCEPGFYCDYVEDQCGYNDEGGVCQSVPNACDDIYDPVCGCDGVLYGNWCEAAVSGVDVAPDNYCEWTSSSFACGDQWCVSGIEYCEVYSEGVTTYSCQALPEECDGEGFSCECLANVSCGDSCEQIGPSAFVVTCCC